MKINKLVNILQTLGDFRIRFGSGYYESRIRSWLNEHNDDESSFDQMNYIHKKAEGELKRYGREMK